ncbi:MAG: hypothetical protein AABW49_04685 [Nanoarchaeota archaeon]
MKYTKAGFEPLAETIIRNDKIGIIIWSDNAESYGKFFQLMLNSATK